MDFFRHESLWAAQTRPSCRSPGRTKSHRRRSRQNVSEDGKRALSLGSGVIIIASTSAPAKSLLLFGTPHVQRSPSTMHTYIAPYDPSASALSTECFSFSLPGPKPGRCPARPNNRAGNRFSSPMNLIRRRDVHPRSHVKFKTGIPRPL